MNGKYRLQSEMENLKEGSNCEWFKGYLKEVLESNKSYFQKADYIAYSINQIQRKIDYVSEEIKELQELKKSLTTSKEIAMQLCASVLGEYGIEKIEGATISSITITPESTKTKESLTIKDENALMDLGYVAFGVDTKAIEQIIAKQNSKKLNEIKEYISVESTTTTVPAKIKINNKRSTSTTANNNNAVEVEEILNVA